MSLRVRVLGALALELDGAPLEPPAGRRARELLGWLALHPGPQPRAAVAALLWPDVLDESARTSLRTTLHELRAALGPAAGFVVADRQSVGLEGEGLWVDVRDDAAAGGGELLAGLEAEWVLAERDRLHERGLERLEAAAAEAEAAGDLAAAVARSRERAGADPLSEDAGRALMRRLAAAGDRGAALAAYERLRERLRTGLGVAPSAATRALADEIRAEAPPPDDRAALPSSLGRARRPEFVGRAPELVRLLEALDRAGSGERQVALVAGEPGIGKTRLLGELGRRAQETGATVLYGRCREEPLAPFQPLAEALGRLAEHAPVEVERAAGPDAPELTALLPGLPETPRAGDPESARWRMFEAVDRLLCRLSERAPVVLALDDLHWADGAMLQLAVHLGRSARPARLLVLAACRTVPAVLSTMRAERIALAGLDEAQVSELVGAWLGSTELAATLHASTQGNPFFVEELVQHVAEAGAIGIPDTVRALIELRVDRLGDEARRALTVAAVAGAEFDLDLVERVVEADTLDALEAAGRAQLVREDPTRPGRFAFVHALVRDVLYAGLGATRRARVHAAVADALTGAPPAVLAHHRLEARDLDAAVGPVLAAAGEASAAHAYVDAAALCERALALADDPPCDLLLALGDARLRAGRGDGAQTAFAGAAAAARRLADPERLARAALGHSGLGVTIIGLDRTNVALLEEALQALPPEGALRARVLARLAVETYYDSTPARRRELGDAAVELARVAGDDRALVEALGARRVALWSPAFLRERLDSAAEMLAVAEQSDDAEGVLQARNWLVTDLYELGDLPAMEREIAAHAELADRLRLPAYQWWAPLWRSTLAIAQGRTEDAERLIDEAARIGAAIGDANAALYARLQRNGLRKVQGRHDEEDDERYRRNLDRPAGYAYRAGLAWLLAGRGDRDESREHVEWLAAGGFARLGEDMNRLGALAAVTQALRLLDAPDHAAAVHERLLPYADRNIVNARGAVCYGSVAHHLGVLSALLGRTDEAVGHFAAALDRDAAFGNTVWLARTRAALAELG